LFSRSQGSDSLDVKNFVAGQAKGLAIFAGLEFERQDAHANQIAAVNPLVTFGQDGADAEEASSFGSPVARGAGAVLFSGDHKEGTPSSRYFTAAS